MGFRSDGFDFEREWPGLQERLRRTLGSWRVPRWLADDLVQETGARMWAIRAQIDPNRSVEGLAHRIATNLLKDHLRQQKHLVPGGDLLAIAMAHDVEGEVIARDEWRRVKVALAKLNPARRAALIDAMAADGTASTAPAALRMMKMRARKQLRFLMDEATNAKAGCLAAIHRSWDAVIARGLGFGSPRGQHAAQVVTAAVILAAAGAIPVPSSDGPFGMEAAPPPSRSDAGAPRVTLAADNEKHDYDWSAEIDRLAAVRRDTAERRRDKARRLFRIGPLSYGEGDSLASGTLRFDPNRITLAAPGTGISPDELVCRVGVLRNCKERKKH